LEFTIAFGSGCDAQAASKAADAANSVSVEARRRRGRAEACIIPKSPTVSIKTPSFCTAEEPKHSLDETNGALNPDPLCAGIVYHGINRLWPEPGKIVAPLLRGSAEDTPAAPRRLGCRISHKYRLIGGLNEASVAKVGDG